MSDMPMNGAGAPVGADPAQQDPGADPLAQALAAGGQGPEGAVPDDHEPTYPGHGLEPVPIDEVEQELLRAIRQAGRLAAGASDGTTISAAGAGALAFVTALEKLNAPDPTQAPAQQLVMPHAVGIVRHALAADHGVPQDTFDELLNGAHQHLADLQTAGTPGEPAPGEPAPGEPADTSGDAGSIPAGPTS